MRRGRWLALALPCLWLLLFVLVPLLIVTKISLSRSAVAQPPYRPHMPASLDGESWRAALGELGLDSFRALAQDPLYRDAALGSLALAGTATLLIALIGFPIALALARAPRGWRPVLVALVVLPFWTSLLVRLYAWIAVLKDDGWLNAALLALGLIGRPIAILNTDAAVLIGVVYAYLPFMILPLYAALDRQDPGLVEAAADLGAGPLAAFWTVTFPLARPGLAAGALLCFIPILGEVVAPELLGGPDTLMLGRVLWSEFFTNRDWPLASALALVLVALMVPPIVLYREAEARRAEAAR